jgi:hypothetical protein
MSKGFSLVVVCFVVIAACGSWATFAVEIERRNSDLRQLEMQRQAAMEAVAYSAWHHASRYETFWVALANSRQEPKRSDTLTERVVWIKSFQRGDVKALDKSQKYGNAAYRINTIIAFNDSLSKDTFERALINKAAPSNVLFDAFRGDWHTVTMECNVERLDGGEWITDDYKFAPASGKPDFPFEKIKGE